jgi:hypothetical protein
MRDVFGIGRYGLAATFDANLTVPPGAIEAALREPLDTVRGDDLDEVFRSPADALFNDDLHADDNFATAASLKTTPGYASQTHYGVVASTADPSDVDFYRIKSPKMRDEPALVLTVTVTALDINGAVPRALVFDGDLNPVAVQTLVNGNGTYTIQADQVAPGANYFVRLAAAPSAPAVGNYSLSASFGRQTANLAPFAQGSLNDAVGQRDYTLYVAQSQLFQFVLAAGSPGAANGPAVRLTISDRNGRVVHDLTAPPGDAVSGSTLFLAPGEYTIRFLTAPGSATSSAETVYVLNGANLTDPVGPALLDATLDPLYTNPNGPPPFSYPDGTVSQTPYHLIEVVL